MLKQQLITLKKIDLDQFLAQGAIILGQKPGELYLGFGNHLEGFTDETSFEFRMLDFFGEKEKSYIPEFLIQCELKDLKKYIENNIDQYEKDHKISASYEDNLDDLYENDFHHTRILFENKSLRKIVLKSRQYYECSIDVLKTLCQLLKLDAYLYGMWDENYGMIGATPEILVAKDHQKFQTMALAGTREITKRDELLIDKKELEEHQLVIQDIKDKLSVYDLNIANTDLVNFKNFSHLRTLIDFESNDHGSTIVKKMTPTAALGGYPSALALHELKRTEYHQNINETFFGGAFSLSHKDFFFSVVAIRNVQWTSSICWIESGTGIVKESKLTNELNEIKLKRLSIESLVFKVN